MGRDSKTTSRLRGSSSSMMSARSAGCSSGRRPARDSFVPRWGDSSGSGMRWTFFQPTSLLADVVAEEPADEADEDPLEAEAAHETAGPDVDVGQVDVAVRPEEVDIVDADHLRPADVDDLLVQHVLPEEDLPRRGGGLGDRLEAGRIDDDLPRLETAHRLPRQDRVGPGRDDAGTQDQPGEARVGLVEPGGQVEEAADGPPVPAAHPAAQDAAQVQEDVWGRLAHDRPRWRKRGGIVPPCRGRVKAGPPRQADAAAGGR